MLPINRWSNFCEYVANMFTVWLLPWHVMSMGPDSGLTRHDMMTTVSLELSYCIPWEPVGPHVSNCCLSEVVCHDTV